MERSNEVIQMKFKRVNVSITSEQHEFVKDRCYSPSSLLQRELSRMMSRSSTKNPDLAEVTSLLSASGDIEVMVSEVCSGNLQHLVSVVRHAISVGRLEVISEESE